MGMSNQETQGFEIDRDRMPAEWPTYLFPPEFWEEIGRTIGTLAFLEDCLKRANLAITATQTYRTVEQAEEAFATWERDLATTLNETLTKLAKRITTVVKTDSRYSAGNVEKIEQGLKSVAEWRNVLCHGAWVDYDQESGIATLRYWNKNEWRQQSSRTLSITDLVRIRRRAVDLTFEVIDTVTRQGIRFPGSTSPGKDIHKAIIPSKSSRTGERANPASN